MMKRDGYSINVRRYVNGLALCCWCLTAGVGGCGPGTPQGSEVSLLPQEAGTIPAGALAAGTARPLADDSIRLFAAINETVSFRLRIETGDKALANARLELGELISREQAIPKDAWQAYVVHDVPTQPAGWQLRFVSRDQRFKNVGDVLVPIAPDGWIGNVPPQTGKDVWVDLHVPTSTLPCRYSTNVRLLSGSQPVKSYPVELEVVGFSLPVETDLTLVGIVDQRDLFGHHLEADGIPHAPPRISVDDPLYGKQLALLYKTARLLKEHHVCPVFPHLQPILKRDDAGNLVSDWSEYDLVVSSLLDGQAFTDLTGLPVWFVPFDDTFPPAPAFGRMNSPTYAHTLREYFRQCAAHFARNGWLERSLVLLGSERGYSPQAVDEVKHFGRIAKLADPRLAVLTTIFPQDMVPSGWLGFERDRMFVDFVDVWSPPAQFFDPRELARQAENGCKIWMTADRPPFSGSFALNALDTDTRVIPWQGCRYEAECVLLGSITEWAADLTKDQPADNYLPKTPCLIYPGKAFGLDTPVPSVRLKMLRRGVDDLRYLTLLHRHGRGHIADIIAESLCKFAASDAYGAHFADGRDGGWVRNSRLWDTARLLMLEEIVSALEAGDAPADGFITESVKWKTFLAATRGVQIRCDGVRIRTGGLDPDGAFEIEFQIVVTNEHRTPITGTVYAENLPVGWKPRVDKRTVPTVPPQSSRRLSLIIHTNSLPGNDAGVIDVPIVFEAEGSGRYRTPARVAHLTPFRRRTGLDIDGDLSDWPPGIYNVAGDFLSVSPGPLREPHARGAVNSTRVFLGRDTDNLYFAFSCTRNTPPPTTGRHRNYVEYQDMIPTGDELVEILIDTSNSGSPATAELYHVVVKPNASLVAERGIGLDPPTGRRSPWKAEIRAATADQPDGWTAEIAIPLSAFDNIPRSSTTWGINFTRYDAQADEYSTWSGAEGTAYDPRAMGNITFP